jgi:oxygen-independent coproporphyrinogen-3 oxidase
MANQLVLGPSSYGYINGIQFSNFKNIIEYEKSIRTGKLPVEKATFLSREEIIRRAFIFGLKTNINRKDFEVKHGVDPMEGPLRDEISRIVNAGGISASESEIKLTEAGMLFADRIQMEFYSESIKNLDKHHS